MFHNFSEELVVGVEYFSSESLLVTKDESIENIPRNILKFEPMLIQTKCK